MISTKIMILLLVMYAFLGISTAWERNWTLSLYWTGAIILNIAVLIMAYPKG